MEIIAKNKFNYFNKAKNKKGFTLIELVIAVAVIGILVLFVLPKFNEVTGDSKQQVFEGNHRTLVVAIGVYQAANGGDYPNTDTDLNAYLATSMVDLQDQPTGATYVWDATNDVLTSSYSGTNLTFP